MRRIVPLLFVCLTLAPGLVLGVPGRPRYEPPEPPKVMPAFNFAGTYWTGKCYTDNFWIIFETDGTLTYGYNTNRFKNGTWQLSGQNLYFEMNGKYLEFRGTMQGGVIQGEAWNVAGGRWQTFFTLSALKKGP